MDEAINIDALIDALIEREGGYVNHPADRGGPTRFGITEAVARAHGYGGAMALLPREEAAAIYKRIYWLRPRFDEVAERLPRVAAELFDTGVNMGPAVGATFLQRALTALNRNGKDFGNYILDLASSLAHKGGTRSNTVNVNITNPIFHNEDKALEHIFKSRWPDGEPICPHCGSTNTMQMAGKTQAGYHLCRDCRDKFTVRTGTVMERSHIPLHKWLLATHLMAASKKGMSAKQMERMLGVTYKTAWFLTHRIREAMNMVPTKPLGGPGKFVEADETFVGGKQRKQHRRRAPKKVVVSLVERGGDVRSFHFQRIHGQTIRALVVTNVDRASHLMTDQAHFYRPIGAEFAAHDAVLHCGGEYVRGQAHSNTCENFFSIFKRGIIGTYHHLSEQHLHRYTAEFDLRYNTRDMTDGERANVILKGMEGKRLTYRRIDRLAA